MLAFDLPGKMANGWMIFEVIAKAPVIEVCPRYGAARLTAGYDQIAFHRQPALAPLLLMSFRKGVVKMISRKHLSCYPDLLGDPALPHTPSLASQCKHAYVLVLYSAAAGNSR